MHRFCVCAEDFGCDSALPFPQILANFPLFVAACFARRKPSVRDTRVLVADSYAMEAATNAHTCFYRSGYDISIPLPPKHVFPKLATVSPWDREFLLTTKVRCSSDVLIIVVVDVVCG